jgi:CheY-like chemotaxis protein
VSKRQYLSRVLVVEDTKELLEVIVSCLEGEGFFVYTASNGIEALTILETKSIDIVLTDLEMPKMNGLKLAAETKKIRPETCVIVMSGWSGASADLAELAGADRFFTKPLEWEQVIAFLKSRVAA